MIFLAGKTQRNPDKISLWLERTFEIHSSQVQLSICLDSLWERIREKVASPQGFVEDGRIHKIEDQRGAVLWFISHAGLPLPEPAQPGENPGVWKVGT